MPTPDAYPETPKRRAPRKPQQKLPPAMAHEVDVARAARMGIDISYMAPGERCKYPSKFCCNIRACKSTGKLHRFCEDHRTRANVNQKRWNQVRRRHEQALQHLADAVIPLTSQDDALEWAGEIPLVAKEPVAWDSKSSPSSVAAAWPSVTGDLNDEEIDVLVALVLDDDAMKTSSPSLSAGDRSWSWHPRKEAQISAAPRGQVEASFIYTL